MKGTFTRSVGVKVPFMRERVIAWSVSQLSPRRIASNRSSSM
jgi:hypothetical protein